MQTSLYRRGIYVGSRAMFQDMSRAVAAHRLRPVIDTSFAFDDARKAYHHMKAAGHSGKIVITVPQTPAHEFVINIPATRQLAPYIVSIYNISI